MLKKFAEELKEARTKSGISLQQIHTKTRIDLKFLEAIENGNFEILPEVYLRAIIKEFSNFVGLDDKIELKRYDLAKAGKLIDETEAVPGKEEKEVVKSQKSKIVFTGAEGMSQSVPDESNPRQTKINPKFIFVSFIVFIVLVIVYMIFINGSASEIITERPYEEIISENKQRFEPEEIKSSKAAANDYMYNTKDSLILLIKSKDTSWIGIRVDNKLNDQDFILFPAQQKKIKAARNFQVTIGNAGSVEMILNEKPLNFTGNYREVKFVNIDSTGLSYTNPQKAEVRKND